VLHQFLTANRTELIERWRTKVALRRAPEAHDALFKYGFALFIEELAKTLRMEQTSLPVCGASEISRSAMQHGRELLQHGLPVDQVVHDYGDLCQAITELASEFGTPVQISEFRTLNHCLDTAIADAVAEYSFAKNVIIAEQGMQALNERLGFLAHELRNHIHTASLARLAIRSCSPGLEDATSAVLDRSLIELRSLIDRSLADVRVTGIARAQATALGGRASE
jgi:hypothetical protein